MSFKKLALAAAVAAAPMGAFAMQPMNDAEMSSVTGQDGISITLNANVSTDVWIEDTDGFAGYSNGGFMTIAGLDINLNNVTINLDVASDDGGTPGANTGAGTGVLQVAIGIPEDIVINDLSIGVQGSSAVGGEVADFARVGNIADSTEVLSMGTITLSASDIVLQLGPQAGTVTPGATSLLTFGAGAFDLEILDVQLYGGNSVAGYIGADAINVNNIDLAGTTADMTADGLVVTLGASMNNLDVSLSRLTLGDDTQPALGNVYLTSLDIAGATLTVSGK